MIALIVDHIEWDEYNLEHATKRLTAAEIEQAIWNAVRWTRHNVDVDRRLIAAETDGGKRVLVIVLVTRTGVRPITGWEE